MLEAINHNKVYKDKTVLRNLNIGIRKGETFCLLGQNGVHKATTISLFLDASGGSVKIVPTLGAVGDFGGLNCQAAQMLNRNSSTNLQFCTPAFIVPNVG